MKKKWIAALCALMLFTFVSYCADEPTFHFTLTADGKKELYVQPGDIVTVSFTLTRTDANDPCALLAMQNEIRYDSRFFTLVEDSLFLRDGITAHEIDARGGQRELYMNFVSLSGGTTWKPKTIVGSFQLQVIADTGAAVIGCDDFGVSLPGGQTCVCTADTVSVILSDRCTVTFVEDEDTAYTKEVSRGATIEAPSAPQRNGASFVGWFTDVDRQQRWDFSKPVAINMQLYALWSTSEGAKIEAPLPFTDVSPDDWFYDSVRYVYEAGMMNGDSPTRFAPEDAATRAMLVTILWRLEGRPIVNYAMQFADVAPDDWYTEAIRWAASEKLVTGYSDTEFAPDAPLTREQLCAILWRYAKYRKIDVSAAASLDTFQDAESIDDYAIDAMRWASGIGLIQGVSADSIAPHDTATRAQTATILMRFSKSS